MSEANGRIIDRMKKKEWQDERKIDRMKDGQDKAINRTNERLTGRKKGWKKWK